jgi:hypothetical protein
MLERWDRPLGDLVLLAGYIESRPIEKL